MVKKTKFNFPKQKYLNTIIEGYKNCGLNIKYLEKSLSSK
jgi:hypothetical protein